MPFFRPGFSNEIVADVSDFSFRSSESSRFASFLIVIIDAGTADDPVVLPVEPTVFVAAVNEGAIPNAA